MKAVSVYKKSGHQQVPDRSLRGVDWLAEDDDGAIGAIGQMENGRRTGTAQNDVIAAQNDRLANLNLSSGQINLAAGIRQGVQGTLDVCTGDASGQNGNDWFNGGNLCGGQANGQENQHQPSYRAFCTCHISNTSTELYTSAHKPNLSNVVALVLV
jgi:hypothetical protein